MNRMLNQLWSLYLRYDMILGHAKSHVCACLCSYTQPWSNNAIVLRCIPGAHCPTYPARNAPLHYPSNSGRCAHSTSLQTRGAAPAARGCIPGAQRPQHEVAYPGRSAHSTLMHIRGAAPAALSCISGAQRPRHEVAYPGRSAHTTLMHIRGAAPAALSCISGAQRPADIYKSEQLEKYIVITTSTCMSKHY